MIGILERTNVDTSDLIESDLALTLEVDRRTVAVEGWGGFVSNPTVAQSRDIPMKKTCTEFILIAILAVCALVLPARADTVVVVCKSDFQLALVDPATQKVLVKLPTGLGPHEVAVSPDGRSAYVSNFGRYSVFPAGDTEHDKAGHTITVVDLVQRKVKATFDLGTHTGPHGMIVSHDGKLLWTTRKRRKLCWRLTPPREKFCMCGTQIRNGAT
jgi:hypothetical protein